jgi:Core-2/I-Branching enzyme.
MAHGKFDILSMLLEDLDDERNNIFLHVDSKAKGFDKKNIKINVHKAKLIILERIPVFWGDYSQIQCILNLLKEAVNYEYHDYYHLVAGVEFPIKSQQYIHDFFEKNKGHEFIGFNNSTTEYTERMQYYYFFRKYCRYRNLWERFLGGIGYCLVPIQRKLGVNRIRNCNIEFKKGYANWSITQGLACYVIEQEKEIYKRYRYTFCTDEVFLHTLVYNSQYYNQVYDLDDEYHSAMSLNTWTDPKNQYHRKDIPMLLQSDRLFAKKFDDDDAVEIITQIRNERR